MLAGLGSGEPGPGGSPSLTTGNIYATLSSWSIIFTRDTLIYTERMPVLHEAFYPSAIQNERYKRDWRVWGICFKVRFVLL